MDAIDRLDGERERWDVLSHPFYVRWSAGELCAGELALYASQYRHLVQALADLSVRAADCAPELPGLRAHAEEEAEHVALWDEFAGAAGGGAQVPTAQTRECAEAWRRPRTLAARLATMYVIEAGQPQIAATKLAGLVEHYGYAPDSPACGYFREHSVTDIEHAEQARKLIRRIVPAGDRLVQHEMLTAARGALEGNWRMLDGVERAHAPQAAA